MSSRSSTFTDAILLRSVDYRDRDRIVTLYTEAFGKVSVLARGAKASRRRFAGSLEPYALLNVEVGFGQGELGRLGQARIQSAYAGILTDLTRMSIAGAGLELVREATPARHPDARAFSATLLFLESLSNGAPPEEILWSFQIRFMALMGFEPGVDVCARTGRRAREGQTVLFDPLLGSIVSRDAGGLPLRLGSGARERIRRAVTARWAEGLGEWEAVERQQIAKMVNDFVASQLGRPLRGAEVVAQVREVRERYPSS